MSLVLLSRGKNICNMDSADGLVITQDLPFKGGYTVNKIGFNVCDYYLMEAKHAAKTIKFHTLVNLAKFYDK